METQDKPHSTKKPRSLVDLLRVTYQERKERNAYYSLNSFARDLGISKSQLSRIFSGERPVTLKLAIQITAALDLNEQQSKFFTLSVVQSASKNAKISKKIRTKIEKEAVNVGSDDAGPLYTTVELERFKALAGWHHLAILNLVSVRGFKDDPIWIAKRLGITSIEAQAGLERLFSLGLLVQKDKAVTRTSSSLHVKTDKSEFAVRKFHEQMITKGLEELKKTRHEDFKNRLITGITFPSNPRFLELIKEKINRLQDEIIALSDAEENEEVYQMNVQFFPLTKPNGDK